MNIPLSEFEQIIDETILKRGLSYFKKGYVSEPVEISTNEYEATVQGTEDYIVQLEIENDVITQHVCDCPYDMGPVCKHIVAVIFYLQQDILELNKKPTRTKKKRTTSVTQQVKNTLKALSSEELQEFIQEHCKKDRQFRNYFLASFAHLSKDQDKTFYQNQIKNILKTAAGRDQFIDWSAIKYVMKSIQPIINTAEKYLENGGYEQAMHISTALLEEMNKAIHYSDDSAGEIGYFIHFSTEVLHKIADSNTSSDLKTTLFDYCIKIFKKGEFSGWDWHMELLRIAEKLIGTSKQVDDIISCLNTTKDGYEREYSELILLNILRKYRSESETQDFIKQHLSNPRIRYDEIKTAFEHKDYSKAKSLSFDGIEANKMDKPGYVTDWYRWLLKIAQAEKDVSKVIEYAKYLLLNDFRSEQDYYTVLKQHIDISEWKYFIENLITEIKTNGRNFWRGKELIRNLYIKEAWWDKLFELLKENISLESIEHNENYLANDYATELIELYDKCLVNYMEHTTGRSHYKRVCKYLRRMKKLGGIDNVNKRIAYFKESYPQRRAFMDELSRV